MKINLITRASKPNTRGKAKKHTQLSWLQNHILLWLLNKQEEIESLGNDNEIRVMRTLGVPWASNDFWKDHDFLFESGNNVASTISNSLRNLDEKRRLIKRFDTTAGRGNKRRTSHVLLTDSGMLVAKAFREDPRPAEDKHREFRIERVLTGIEKDLYFNSEYMDKDRLVLTTLRYKAYRFMLERVGGSRYDLDYIGNISGSLESYLSTSEKWLESGALKFEEHQAIVSLFEQKMLPDIPTDSITGNMA